MQEAYASTGQRSYLLTERELVISSACPTSQCPGGAAHKFVALRTVSTLSIVVGRYFTLVSLHLWRCLRFKLSTVWKTFLFGNRDRYTCTVEVPPCSVHRHVWWMDTPVIFNRFSGLHREHAPIDVVGKVPMSEVAESVIRRPQNTSFVDRQWSRVLRSGLRWSSSQLHSHAVSAHLRASTERKSRRFRFFRISRIFGFFQLGKVQNFPASRSSSELSSHQMAPSGVIAH